MGFLEIFQDTFSSGFDSAFLLFISFCFQGRQLGFLLLDIAALRDFEVSITTPTIGLRESTMASNAPKSVKTHSVQNRCPSLQASGVRARSRQSEHALNNRMDSFPSLCRFVP